MIDLSGLKETLGAKPVAVVGLGKSGLPVFEACRAAGIATVLWDDGDAARDAAARAGGTVEDLRAASFSRFSALCLAPGIPLTHPAPHSCVLRARDAGVPVLGDVEIFGRAVAPALVLGITGTNGKSTTTALTGHILSCAGVDSAVGGNIGQAVLTLPHLSSQGVYVVEMSSYQIDLCPTFSPQIAALINFSPDHLDRHGDMDGYVRAKEAIFRGPGVAVIGIDDEWSRAVLERVRRAGQRRVVPVSCLFVPEGGVGVTEEGVLMAEGLRVADLTRCPALRGRHNWQNAAISAALCLAAGVPADKIAAAMESFPGLAHRQNVVVRLNHVTYVNDSKATNDQAAAMALGTFDPIYWIAGGKSKGGGYADCARHLKHVRRAFLIGAAQAEMAAWLAGEGVAYEECGALDKAFAAAHELAQAEGLPGATVLLSPACASFDQFTGFEARGDAFAALARRAAGEARS